MSSWLPRRYVTFAFDTLCGPRGLIAFFSACGYSTTSGLEDISSSSFLLSGIFLPGHFSKLLRFGGIKVRLFSFAVLLRRSLTVTCLACFVGAVVSYTIVCQ